MEIYIRGITHASSSRDAKFKILNMIVTRVNPETSSQSQATGNDTPACRRPGVLCANGEKRDAARILQTAFATGVNTRHTRSLQQQPQ